MPVDWKFAGDVIRLGGVDGHKIAVEDGARQQETARSILSDLEQQPGVILADEVGMGKTYVALAVIASVVRATRGSGKPVVVMVPAGLARKWPREWDQFKALCCAEPDALSWVRDKYVHTPTEFFKARNNTPGRRPHIIWMTTGCFGRGLSDPWMKLALVRFARSNTKMDEETKKKIYKWAATLVRLKGERGLTPELVGRLMTAHVGQWRRILVREGILGEDADDPVPQLLLQHQHEVDWSPLVAVLRGEAIPGRRGVVSRRRLNEARSDLNDACQQVYWDWLSRVRWRASLLVLDEAHHAKNDYTRLASLFRSEEARRLVTGEQPLLSEKFDRMLFLTATPFQLGHHELIRVLRSFSAAKWSGPAAPAGTREEFLGALDELEKRMNENRLAGRRLDRLWGRLAGQAIEGHSEQGNSLEAAANWWRRVRGGSLDPVDRELLAAIDVCRQTKARAESDAARPWCSLRPWVIRHNRPTEIAGAAGTTIPRRHYLPGRSIIEAHEAQDHGSTPSGLPISGEGALPFLLAARAQGELAQGSAKGRAFFAEGLCSSYEAFHHTRDNRGDARDVDDDGAERADSASVKSRAAALIPVTWYEEQIQSVIPSKAGPEEDRYTHPKIRAVVERVVSLWLSGEKVLVFCFYRETAKALREHIGREVERAILRLAAEKLGRDATRDAEWLRSWFERVARRLADEDSPFNQAIVETLRESLELEEFSSLKPHAADLVQLLAAYVRSPSFIARYLPLDVAEVRDALSEGSSRAQVVRAGAAALSRALVEGTDFSAMSMRRRVEEFLRFAKELAELGTKEEASQGEQETIDPLTEYLDAIAVYVSPKRAGDDDDQDAAAKAAEGAYRVLPTVRMVYGDTKPQVRERLMLAFNSPLFPEILISSAVLAEGVDLHRFCRYVVHHDLCWNPSTLEQRTGRLDRIGCKAEASGRPIVVYEPYLGGSADEKMFRVVRDRERWFQIVMGQKFEFDEASSEELANRVLLPPELAEELIFDLRRWRKDETRNAVA
jgi:superfamily II DNA or RNA helicase